MVMDRSDRNGEMGWHLGEEDGEHGGMAVMMGVLASQDSDR